MCGRFYLESTTEGLGEALDAVVQVRWSPRWNIAPTQEVPVLRRALELSGASRREVVGMRWGLVPGWAKDPSIGSRMINARAETAAEKPSFRRAWIERRCLLPASGFYEWVGTGGAKQPHLVRRADEALLGLAGLWEAWRAPNGDTHESVTILTTTPNRFMSRIHDRMPVILERGDWDRWLDDGSDGTSSEAIAALAVPAGEALLVSHPVSRRVNSPSHDAPDCITPIAS